MSDYNASIFGMGVAFIFIALMTSCSSEAPPSDSNTADVKNNSEVARVCADATLILKHGDRYWRYVSGHPMFFTSDTHLSKTCKGDSI